MNYEEIMQVIDKVSESKLQEFSFEENGMKLHLKKAKPVMAKKAAITNQVLYTEAEQETIAEVQEPIKEGTVMYSPLVGTFYAAPSEDEEAFVKVGDSVKKGQVLGIVEAMKLMNEIEAETDGIIKEILVENAQSIEYDQPLFRIG